MSNLNCARSVLLAGLLLSPNTWGEEPAVQVEGPVSPQESLRHLVLADDDLAVELVAAEPEVIDPVAIRFDEDGRMWVAEMRDYPLGPKGGGKPTSRIKVLEDRDNDGRFETAWVFADELLFVTGLQPWKGGLIVTLSGRVAYMKDTDGDGRMDQDQTWFTGFSQQNSQLRANHPTLALDNWVYVPNGLRGGKVVNHLARIRGEEKDRNADLPPAEIPLSGMDFRFNPLTGEAEAVSGNGQFGLAFDDWGNRFICSNRNPCMHVVIENRYLTRAPQVAIPAVVQDVAAAAENSRIYPLTRAWTTSNLHSGQFTAACGVFIYRGDLLPRLRDNVFTCDPTGNLIHREIMQEKGPTFESKPAYDGKEFLASRDEWFRPVSMQLGPDGALYVVDMYRAVIEHPEWVPDELKNRPDERFGDDRGRIYRIVPKGGLPNERRVVPQLSALPSADLVKLLEHENAWQRETAQRLLVERMEEAQFETLLQLAANGTHPAARIHALQVLAGTGGLGDEMITAALADKEKRVRRAAVLLADGKGIQNDTLVWLKAIAKQHDESPALRILAALAISRPLEREIEGMLSDMVIANASDSWLGHQFFLLSGRNPLIYRSVFPGMSTAADASPERIALQVRAVEVGIATGGQEQAEACLNIFLGRSASAQDIALLTTTLRAMERQRITLEKIRESGRVTDLDKQLGQCRESASVIGADLALPEAERASATELIGYLPDTIETLVSLASATESQAVRLAAIRGLARQRSLDCWPPLVERLAEETLTIRSAILDGIFQRPERISLLLDALEADAIRPTELDRVQTDRLLKHGDAKIRERAVKIFGSALPADRKQALEDYQSVLTMKADAVRGKQVFAKNCATCHKIGDLGVNVAPDISDSRTKIPAQILTDIIQPNRAIDANYIAWNILLTDGSSASGVLAAETSTSITLRQPEGKTIVVSRAEIEQLKSSGLSLMPEGLEKNIPPQDMADLISFIKNWRYLDGRTPLGK